MYHCWNFLIFFVLSDLSLSWVFSPFSIHSKPSSLVSLLCTTNIQFSLVYFHMLNTNPVTCGYFAQISKNFPQGHFHRFVDYYVLCVVRHHLIPHIFYDKLTNRLLSKGWRQGGDSNQRWTRSSYEGREKSCKWFFLILFRCPCEKLFFSSLFTSLK